MKQSNPIVAHILKKKAEKESTFSEKAGEYTQHHKSKYDDELKEMLSKYSVENVKGLISGVITEESMTKWERKYVVAAIVKNQPHAVDRFSMFLDWNKDVWQCRLIPALMVFSAIFFPAAFTAIFMHTMGYGNLGIQLLSGIAVTAVLILPLTWMVYRKSMLFINPRFIYNDQLDTGINGDKLGSDWKTPYPESFKNRNFSGSAAMNYTG